MDSSQALDHFAGRRDLLSGFLVEYTLLTNENPELINLLSFDAYVQFSFSFFALRQQHGHYVGFAQQFLLLREHLPPAPPNESRLR